MTKTQLKREILKIMRHAVSMLIVTLLTYYGIIEGNKIDPVEKEPEYQISESGEVHTTNEQYFVTRVVDGDTIVVSIDGTDTTVRYVGIDTPETKDTRKEVECFGVEASNKNAELVEGKFVTLTQDKSDIDKYGRLLRYVSVASGTRMIDVGLELVSGGYASALAIAPDTERYNTYEAAEQIARREKTGLWGPACSQ